MSISNITFLLGSILFWYLVTSVGFNLEDWTFSQLLVYVAYSELFYGFHQNIFGIASSYWKFIYTGALDVQICRPMDTRYRLIFLNADVGGLIFTFIKFIAILCISQEELKIMWVLIGIIIVFLASITFAMMQFLLCYVAFWLHKVDAIVEISENLTLFNKYPLDIFPFALRWLFTVIFPFYFFSTFSAKIVLGKYTIIQIVCGVFLAICNCILWLIINKIVFQRGRMRYESIQG